MAEAIANRRDPRLISVISMIFIAGGLLLFTGVSADGTYLGDIFWGLLVFGPGLGAGFVAGAIASMGGVEPHDFGLAAGLVNTSWQVGGALGIAIMTSVALAGARATPRPSPALPRTPRWRVPKASRRRSPSASGAPSSACSPRRTSCDLSDRAAPMNPSPPPRPPAAERDVLRPVPPEP